MDRTVKRIMVLLALCLGLAAGNPLRAEDRESSADFFEKDYAKSPLGSKDKQRPGEIKVPTLSAEQLENLMNQKPPSDTDQKTPGTRRDPFGEKSEVEKALDKVKEGSPVQQAEEPELTALHTGLVVRSVGMVVNSLDKAHFEKSMKQFIDFVVQKDFDVGVVYSIGDLQLVTDSPVVPMLMARGGVVRIVSNIPKGYDISLSPTWIVKTDQGEILLEAVGDPGKFFSADHKVLVRQ